MASDRCHRSALHRESGNTLVLFPVAVLIVFGLGAVAIDAATLFLGQRRLADLAAAVANDAVAGIDLASFYLGDAEVRLDPARARARAAQVLAVQATDRGFEDPECDVEVAGGRAVVTCEAQVRPILAAFWSAAGRHRIHASESAEGRSLADLRLELPPP